MLSTTDNTYLCITHIIPKKITFEYLRSKTIWVTRRQFQTYFNLHTYKYI